MAAPYIPGYETMGTTLGDGGGFWSGLGGQLEGAVTGFVPSIKLAFGAAGHDIGQNIRGHSTGLFFTKTPGGHFGQQVVIPQIQQQQQFFSDPWGEIKKGHLLIPATDILTALSLGAGRVAAVGLTPKELGASAKLRAALTGKYEGPVHEITTVMPSGKVQVLKTVPRSGYRTAKALAGEKAKVKVFGTTGRKIGGKTVGSRFGTYARGAKAEKREANAEVLAAVSDPRVVAWQNAYKKLSVPERITFHVKARLPFKQDLETWKGLLQTSDQPAAKQTLDLINKGKVKDLYSGAKVSPKLETALAAWRGVSDARQEILVKHGAIEPWQIAEGQLRHTMWMRGAEVLTRSKAYQQLRSIDMELNKLTRGVTGLVAKGGKVGQKEIKAQIKEGRQATTQGLKTEAERTQFEKLTNDTDQKLQAARALREDWRTKFTAGVSTTKDARALGALQNRMAKAYDDYERALTAEHSYARAKGIPTEGGLQYLAEKGATLAERRQAAKAGVPAAREARIKALQAMRAQMHELIDARHEQQAQLEHLQILRKRIPKSNIGPLVGGPDIETLLNEFEKAGMEPPGYIPDVPAARSREYITTGEGSIGPPRPQADVYPSTGVMFRHGIIDLVGDHITPAFFRAAKHQRQARLHDWALSVGEKIPKGDSLPDGYEWVKKYRGQRIPYSQTAQAEHIRSTNPFDGLNEDEFDQITGGRELTDEEIEQVDNGEYRVAVPKAIADQFRADFTRSKTLGFRFVRNATNVWRALLLRVRVGWLENNIIGNTIMASIRFAGIDGLRAYLSLVGQMAGPKKVAQLLGMDVSKHVLTPEQWARLFPQALRGTHIETQVPKFVQRIGGKTGGEGALVRAGGGLEKLGKGALNLLPNADRWYEAFLRKGGVMTTLRKQPEVRAAYQAQPKGEKSWGNAMADAVEQNPHLQRMAISEMNDALGDFLSMSKLERDQIRQLIPFYAWFREITRITGKTIVDTPGRALLVTQLGLVGNEMTPQDVPSYLRGGIPVGHLPSWLGGTSQYGQQSILATRSMTPYSTPLDLLRAGVSAFQGGTEAPSTRLIAGELNPMLAALLNLQRRASLPGVPLSGTLLAQPFTQTITNLPEYRSLFGRPSPLYPTRGPLDRWSQAMFGNPFRTYDINEAGTRVGE